jgi:uncharacterized protein DUF3631
MTGQDLINRWRAWLSLYLVLTPGQTLTVALWCMHTWLTERFATTGYLHWIAETKRGGKTTGIECASLLSRNPRMFATIRPLVVVRMIEHYHGAITFGFDEAEKLWSAKLDETRTILATGYRKGATHAVSVGAKFQEFPTFSPKQFASIGDIQDVLRDRTIPIYMERKTPPRIKANFEQTAIEESSELVSEFMRWKGARLGEHTRIPIVDPAFLSSARDRELWTPLFSIAALLELDAATRDLLTAAAVDLSQSKTLPARRFHDSQAETDAEDRTMSERCLRDAVATFAGWEHVDAMFSADMVDRMRAVPTSPWRSWRGEGLNEITLAALLSPFGLTPDRVQYGRGRQRRRQGRGYRLADLRKALARITDAAV